MIIIGGKPYRTLADPIYTNGKRVQKVFVNGKQAYPEVYKKPAIGASGNILKIRGKHTTELNFYTLEDEANHYAYNAIFRASVSFAAYLNVHPVPIESYISPYTGNVVYRTIPWNTDRIKNDWDYGKFVYSGETKPFYHYVPDPRYDFINNADIDESLYRNNVTGGLEGEISYRVNEGENFYLNLPYYSSNYCNGYSFSKIVFKLNIEPFYIPLGSKGRGDNGDRYRVEKTFNDVASVFNNKIYTIYSGSPLLKSDNYHPDIYYTDSLPFTLKTIHIDNLVFFEGVDGSIQSTKNYTIPKPNPTEESIHNNNWRNTLKNLNPNGDLNCFCVYFSNDGALTDWISNIKNVYSLEIRLAQLLKGIGTVEPTPSDLTGWHHTQRWPIGESVDIKIDNRLRFNAIGDDIIYLGPSIDPETNLVVSPVQKEDLLDYDGTEEIIEPVYDTHLDYGYSPSKIYSEVHSGPFEVKSYDVTAIHENDMPGDIVELDCPNVNIIGENGLNACWRLISAIFPKVKEIGSSAFFTCTNLVHADFPLITKIPRLAFAHDVELKIANFPLVSIVERGAFMGCFRLASPYLPNVSVIENSAFKSCYSLKEATFPILQYVGEYTFADCANISTAYMPLASYISQYAFYSCLSLKTIAAPMTCEIGKYAFDGCISLSSVNLVNCSSIASFAFRSCSSLTEANFPACTNIGSSAFTDCSLLTEANFPACTSIGESIFENCDNLRHVNFHNLLNMNLYAFKGCTSLISADFHSLSTIAYAAFENCTSLEELRFPAIVNDAIGERAFLNCSSLKIITFDSLSGIGLRSSIFYGCKNLKSLILLYSDSRGRGCRLNANYQNAFEESSLLDGTCKIYVPSETYSYYMQYWSQFASQIVSITS